MGHDLAADTEIYAKYHIPPEEIHSGEFPVLKTKVSPSSPQDLHESSTIVKVFALRGEMSSPTRPYRCLFLLQLWALHYLYILQVRYRLR